MKLPKNLGGWSNPGRTEARRLDEDPSTIWLRARRFGAEARNKGGHLIVRVAPPAEVTQHLPFLWSMYEVTLGAFVPTLGAETAAFRYQLPLCSLWPLEVRSGTYPNVELPVAYATQAVVGDEYIVRITKIPREAYEANYEPRAHNFLELTWCRFTDDSSLTIPSLNPANQPGFNITFSDFLPLLNADHASVFASGYDANTDSYGFGLIGMKDIEDSAERLHVKLRCYYGKTDTRTLQMSEIDEGREYLRYSEAFTTAPGRIQLFKADIAADYPDPPITMFTSHDHGATWSSAPVPELTPYVLRFFNPILTNPNVYSDHIDICAPYQMLAHPIGGGRVALVMLSSKRIDTPFTVEEELASDFFYSNRTCYRFFISDANGQNFVNMPWPLDNEDGTRLAQPSNIEFRPSPNYNGLHPANEFSMAGGLGAGVWSAGPGSFFMSVGVWDGAPSGGEFDASLCKMLYTVDYGQTWAFSDFIPHEALTPSQSVTRPGGAISASFAIAKVAVVKPYVDENNRGVLYLSALYLLSPEAAAETGVTYSLVIHKTDATFSFFELATTAGVPDANLVEQIDRDVPNYMPAALYVGNNQGKGYKPMVRVGYPEFDRPDT